MNRRNLIQAGMAAALAASLPMGAMATTHRIRRVGLQLYSVREAMATDLEGTLAKVAAAGYREVEFAGYFGRTPQQLRALLDHNGLRAPSCHVDLATVTDHWPETLEAAHVLGHRYVVCPWIDEKDRNAAGYKRIAALFNTAGEASQKAGIQFAYHNHNFEFVPDATLGGALPYDVLLAATDPKHVAMELDLCWICVTGQDPLAYFSRYPGRFPLVHVKDVSTLPQVGADFDTVKATMVPVGSGKIDWKRIFAAADTAGIRHYFVEHEFPAPKDLFADLAASEHYLAGLAF